MAWSEEDEAELAALEREEAASSWRRRSSKSAAAAVQGQMDAEAEQPWYDRAAEALTVAAGDIGFDLDDEVMGVQAAADASRPVRAVREFFGSSGGLAQPGETPEEAYLRVSDLQEGQKEFAEEDSPLTAGIGGTFAGIVGGAIAPGGTAARAVTGAPSVARAALTGAAMGAKGGAFGGAAAGLGNANGAQDTVSQMVEGGATGAALGGALGAGGGAAGGALAIHGPEALSRSRSLPSPSDLVRGVRGTAADVLRIAGDAGPSLGFLPGLDRVVRRGVKRVAGAIAPDPVLSVEEAGGRLKIEDMPGEAPAADATPDADIRDPAATTQRLSVDDMVEQPFGKLTDEQANAVIATLDEGLTPAEIAQRTGYAEEDIAAVARAQRVTGKATAADSSPPLTPDDRPAPPSPPPFPNPFQAPHASIQQSVDAVPRPIRANPDRAQPFASPRFEQADLSYLQQNRGYTPEELVALEESLGNPHLPENREPATGDFRVPKSLAVEPMKYEPPADVAPHGAADAIFGDESSGELFPPSPEAGSPDPLSAVPEEALPGLRILDPVTDGRRPPMSTMDAMELAAVQDSIDRQAAPKGGVWNRDDMRTRRLRGKGVMDDTPQYRAPPDPSPTRPFQFDEPSGGGDDVPTPGATVNPFARAKKPESMRFNADGFPIDEDIETRAFQDARVPTYDEARVIYEGEDLAQLSEDIDSMRPQALIDILSAYSPRTRHASIAKMPPDQLRDAVRVLIRSFPPITPSKANLVVGNMEEPGGGPRAYDVDTMFDDADLAIREAERHIGPGKYVDVFGDPKAPAMRGKGLLKSRDGGPLEMRPDMAGGEFPVDHHQEFRARGGPDRSSADPNGLGRMIVQDPVSEEIAHNTRRVIGDSPHAWDRLYRSGTDMGGAHLKSTENALRLFTDAEVDQINRGAGDLEGGPSDDGTPRGAMKSLMHETLNERARSDFGEASVYVGGKADGPEHADAATAIANAKGRGGPGDPTFVVGDPGAPGLGDTGVAFIGEDGAPVAVNAKMRPHNGYNEGFDRFSPDARINTDLPYATAIWDTAAEGMGRPDRLTLLFSTDEHNRSSGIDWIDDPFGGDGYGNDAMDIRVHDPKNVEKHIARYVRAVARGDHPFVAAREAGFTGMDREMRARARKHEAGQLQRRLGLIGKTTPEGRAALGDVFESPRTAETIDRLTDDQVRLAMDEAIARDLTSADELVSVFENGGDLREHLNLLSQVATTEPPASAANLSNGYLDGGQPATGPDYADALMNGAIADAEGAIAGMTSTQAMAAVEFAIHQGWIPYDENFAALEEGATPQEARDLLLQMWQAANQE